MLRAADIAANGPRIGAWRGAAPELFLSRAKATRVEPGTAGGQGRRKTQQRPGCVASRRNVARASVTAGRDRQLNLNRGDGISMLACRVPMTRCRGPRDVHTPIPCQSHSRILHSAGIRGSGRASAASPSWAFPPLTCRGLHRSRPFHLSVVLPLNSHCRSSFPSVAVREDNGRAVGNVPKRIWQA